MPLKMIKTPEKKKTVILPTYILAVAAGKGGVGKSSVTVNVAIALKRAGYSVGIMDSDVYGPSVRRMLPEETAPAQQGEMIQPAISHGIKVISMAYFRKENEAAAVRAPIANGIITQFIKNVNWGVLDVLLIDFPPGTGDIQLTLSQHANLTGALIVTTPQEVALMDVRKAINLFDQVNIPIVGVIENMSYYQPTPDGKKTYLFGKGGGERLASEIGAPFLGQIPIDEEICRAGDEGLPLQVKEGIDSPGAKAFEAIAANAIASASYLKRMAEDTPSTFNLIWKEMT